MRILGRAVTAAIVAAVLLLASWFVLQAVTGATLVIFRTGSMSPTMPQGALALSLPVRAPDIAVGDVVTVQREGQRLPVTHRVMEVRSPAGSPEGTRELVLKGDDNATVDALPYTVTEARRVLLAVPMLGAGLMALQTPPGMLLLTLLAGALVIWAFWPSRRDPTADPDPVDEPPTPGLLLRADLRRSGAPARRRIPGGVP